MLTLGYGPDGGSVVLGCVMNLGKQRDRICGNFKPTTPRIDPSWRNSVGTFGVMLQILEVDETMQQWGLVADIEATEFGLVAWQK